MKLTTPPYLRSISRHNLCSRISLFPNYSLQAKFFSKVSLLAVIVGLITLQSCSKLVVGPSASRARLGEVTSTTETLKKLPPPKEQIVVAVYKFRDQTGQYRPSENGNSWSTAVTQGATTILIKALEDSKWFVPIERENVGNLLNERKIIRSSRNQFNGTGDQKSALPPLLYAGVILEGGIISYDANIITGGAGLRYFGAGGSSQYRQDRVTVYLRAISTANGKVLKTVYTSKTILSQSLDAGLFQFVRFSRLLETEVGFTYNEPSEMAVSEAIEKAVQALIIEGVIDNLWELKEPRLAVDRTFLDYQKEKALLPQTDIFGNTLDNRRTTMAFGINSATLQYKGDYPDPIYRSSFEADFTYSTTPTIGFKASLGMNQLATKRFYAADVSYLNLNALYRPLPFDAFSPVLLGGVGFLTENAESRFDYSSAVFPKMQAGLGFEYMLGKKWSLNTSVMYNYIFSDNFDLIEQGKYNDYYWQGNIGFNFYFGKKIQSQRAFNFNPETDDTRSDSQSIK